MKTRFSAGLVGPLVLLVFGCSTPSLTQSPPEPLSFVKKVSPEWIPGEEATALRRRPTIRRRPSAPLVAITRNTARWGVPGGKQRAVFQKNLGVYDETAQAYHVSEPELWTTADGYIMLDGQIRIELTTVNGSSVLSLSKAVEGVTQGYSLTLPAMELVVGAPGFSYQAADSTLRLNIYGAGFDLFTAPIQQQRAAAVPYTFPYTETGISMTVQPDGSLAALPLWQLTRAVMLGANKEVYPCGAWAKGAGEVSFVCDDTALPVEAFPYVVDPTGIYEPQAAQDDGHIWSVTSAGTPWPPSPASGANTGDSSGYSEREYRVGGNQWVITVSVIVFDTSGLPDAAVINSATLNLYGLGAVDDVDGFFFAGEYWDTANMPINIEDYATSISQDAVSNVALSTLTGSGTWNVFNMLNLTSIVTTGDTGLRVGLNGPTLLTEPTGLNTFRWGSYGSGNNPYLEVVYDETPAVGLPFQAGGIVGN